MSNTFIHLHLHTEYSIVDSTVRIPSLMQHCASGGMPAVALTDQGNVFGLIKFFRKALQGGVKPLVGADVRIADPLDDNRSDSIVLLCQNRVGYRNLTRLITRSWLEGQHRGEPRIQKSWLDRDSCHGLIALSGGRQGDIGRNLINDHVDIASQLLVDWRDLFDDRFFLELIRTGRSNEEKCIEQSLVLANEYSVPVVATNDVRFLLPDNFNAHEARVCIHDGRTLADTNRPRLYSEQQYLRSCEEMAALFADIPESLANSVEIAKRCSLDLQLGKSFLPVFPVPDGTSPDAYLRNEAKRGLDDCLQQRLKSGQMDPDKEGPEKAPYERRLSTELSVICDMGFAGYFLIVADFISWAKKQEIPVGPGRGSGAGSLVAYVLGITNLDPLEHDLLFERFLNPERVSMPDFDIDFCMEGRDRVIEYVADRYGRDRVSQIITYGTMAAKAVIRDAGRVLSQPYGFVDRIAKQVPFEIGMTLDKALEQEAELAAMYHDDEEVRAIIDLAKSLEGLVRNAGKHAGGVVIAPSKLTDFTPLYCEEGGVNVVTQLDKDDVEAVGLVKFDFLGLRTLTIIDWAVRIINRQRSDDPLNIENIPMQDERTFELLRSCKTTAVFQLESRGMRDLIKRMQPEHFDDLVALVALFRPGPLQSGMVDDFIVRRHDVNKIDIDYFHPDLQPVLKETYGVILGHGRACASPARLAATIAALFAGGAGMSTRSASTKLSSSAKASEGLWRRSKPIEENGLAESARPHTDPP